MYVSHLACPKCNPTYESEKYPESVTVKPPVRLPGAKLPIG